MAQQTLYLAVNKETGRVMSGAKGQYAFDSKATLGRSVGQSYQFEAHGKGVKPRDLYDVYAIDSSVLLQYADKAE